MNPMRSNDGSSGFTLIELLVSMVVLVMLVGISVPSFTHLVERQRVEAVMLRLETDLALARNTALARRQSVLVCPRNGDGECQPDLDWSGGWTVFVEDPQHSGQTKVRLWGQPPFADAGHSIKVGSTRPLLRYRHDGTSDPSCLPAWAVDGAAGGW